MTETEFPKTRLFTDRPLAEGALIIDGDQAHFLMRVMRLKAGDCLSLFNGRDGEWLARIETAHKKQVDLVLLHQRAAQHHVPDCKVCFAPVKFGKIDFLAQKVTELGAASLQPVSTEYTIVSRVNTDRLRANTREAAEQSERVCVPQVYDPVSLRQMLADWDKDRLLVFADESGQSPECMQQLSGVDVPKSWGVLIGPEGGFSQEEGELIRSQPFTLGVGLGPRILRADTAALTILALTQSLWGDWEHAPHYIPQGDKT